MNDEKIEHLKRCTVRLNVAGSQGTGFFVAQRKILTCAHVVKWAKEEMIAVFWKAENKHYSAKIETLLEDPDLALLQLEGNIISHPCIFLDANSPNLNENLYIFGYPKDSEKDYSEGDSGTFQYEGESYKQGFLLHKLKSGQLSEGFSGAPLMRETGGVCGVVHLSRDTSSDLGGRAIATVVILEYFPQLKTDRKAATGINFFDYGTPVSIERFYGRRKAIIEVKSRIGAISAQCINIVGMRRVGKTSLLRYIKECPKRFFDDSQRPLIVSLDLQNKQFHRPEGIIEGLRRGINKLTKEEPWLKENNDDPFEVEDGLERIKNSGYRLIVMLDEFERISNDLKLFQDWGEDWRAKACADLLTMVVASLRPIAQVYQNMGLTSPFTNIFSTTILGALEDDSWRSLVEDGFKNNGGVNENEIRFIDELGGGLPYYVKMAGSMVFQYGNLEEAKREFRRQAFPRFDELWRDLIIEERQALIKAAGVSGLAAVPLNLIESLQDNGLLRKDGRLFSAAFAEFILSK